MVKRLDQNAIIFYTTIDYDHFLKIETPEFRAKIVWEHSEVYRPPPGKERQTSNNLAEYLGLIVILEHFIRIKAQHEPIMIYGDSKLVIQQMTGRWKIKEGIYEPFAQRAKSLTKEFSHIGWQWVPRSQNTIADGLSKAHLPSEKK
jgi:ribonuclease HI